MNRREWGGGRVGVAQVSLRAEKPQEKVWKAEPREVGGFSDAVFFANAQTLYMSLWPGNESDTRYSEHSFWI